MQFCILSDLLAHRLWYFCKLILDFRGDAYIPIPIGFVTESQATSARDTIEYTALTAPEGPQQGDQTGGGELLCLVTLNPEMFFIHVSHPVHQVLSFPL